MAEDAKLELTTKIIAAFVSRNVVPTTDLPGLISSVYAALGQAAIPSAGPALTTSRANAAQIRRSITPDALVSFEDGKPYKMLKRHLTALGLSLSAYKEKWGLPANYPTTSPNYSAQRSVMASRLDWDAGSAPKRGRIRAVALRWSSAVLRPSSSRSHVPMQREFEEQLAG